MRRDELEKKMREVLKKFNKPQSEIDTVVNYILNLPYMQTDTARLLFYEEWKGKYEDER